MTNAARTPADLVAELDRSGELPAGLGPLLTAVPREDFIPARVWVKRRPVDRSADPVDWMNAVYSDTAIVTQYDDGRIEWPDVGDYPTCSASQPSVVAKMLKELRVEEGHSVLEIGAGTGFNAALLRQIVGSSGRVTTMEVDRDLATWAEGSLLASDCGDVSLIPQDATFGWEKNAPYDRIIATAAVHLGRVPYAWVEQTTPGGFILAPVRTDMTGGPLVRFTVHGDGTATGRTLPMGVVFMESRSQRSPDVPDHLPEWDHGPVIESEAAILPWSLLDDPSARWALAVAMPGCRAGVQDPDPRGTRQVWFRDPVTHSWASVREVRMGECTVRQSGVRRLWDEAQAAYRWWRSKGDPHITTWTWTITPDNQSITLP
ncbi:protein-L-isoaspartate(D-aspartate) O-methyltransferase [Amycolatopsis sp. QT-25]|uniref:protein-L-isoaspartate(D-aspartate) O-methyltransferase n=1 Tax=Amycolatopsis sp. QT-25 TaxID=3034022 RepID=UPI0023EB888F|nr:protein-L-isoaspartate(D-aspartate) O-methyltransferase [Amycolatopsis sp. QT-25]WET76870.1 protein-L-isoaspartate(D-aspartate) O-methyltransferase [Amycolatopsis sp. QT-25]